MGSCNDDRIQDRRGAVRVLWLAVVVPLSMGLWGEAAWGDEPPKKSARPSTTTQPAAGGKESEKRQSGSKEPAGERSDRENGGEDEALRAAKQAAMQSVTGGITKQDKGSPLPPKRSGAGGRQSSGLGPAQPTSAPAGHASGRKNAASGEVGRVPSSRDDAAREPESRDAKEVRGVGGRPLVPVVGGDGKASRPPSKHSRIGPAGQSPASPATRGSRPSPQEASDQTKEDLLGGGPPPLGKDRPASRTDRPVRPSERSSESSHAADGNEAAPAPVTNINTTMTFTMGPPDPEGRTYRFDYDRTAWSDVLADFARMSGLSWLNEPDPPINETLTFRSPREFTYKEAMEQLNELLLSRPLNKYLIQRQERYLTIKRLPDVLREIPVERMYNSFEEFQAANLDRFDVALTYFDVPAGWSPFQVIEEFRPMFSDTYGTQVVGDRIELSGLVEEHYRFRDVVSKLAAMPPPPSDPRPSLTIELKTAKASDVQTILKQVFPGAASAPRGGRGPGVDLQAEQAKQVTILPDLRSNRLYIRAPNDVLVEIVAMVKELDAGRSPEPPVMKVIKLEHAGAQMVQAALKPLFQTQKAELAKTKSRDWVPPEVELELDRDLIADVAGNSVILIGSKEGVAGAEALVKQWDVPDTNEVNEIIELQHADAAVVAATISALMTGGQPKGALPPRLVPQTATKILVSCGKQELARIKELVAKLDVPPDDEEKEHFVKLKSAMPSAIAPVLSQIVGGQSSMPQIAGQPRVQGRPAGAPPVPVQRGMVGVGGVRLIPDDASRTLIVFCKDKDWEKIEPLIGKLDQFASEEPVLQNFALGNAKAADVVAMLQQLFPPTAEAGMNPSTQIFTADAYNNAVQIFAKQAFIDKIAPFIEQLDIQTESPLTVIKLEHAPADEIAPVLIQSFAGGSAMPIRQPVRMPQGKGQRPQPMPILASPAGSSPVRIVAEPITNSLLVNAPPKELEQIKQLVAEMESTAAAKTESRVIFTPENRTPAEIADTLMSLLGGGGPIARRPGQPAAPAASPSGLKAVVSGNRIILDGPQDEVAKAVQLAFEIDVVEQSPVTRKYVVMDAEEDAKKLSALLGIGGGAARAPQRPGKPGAPSSPTAVPVSSESITIYPDTYENVLLIRAMPKDFAVIDEMLRLILGESEQVAGTEPIEVTGDFWVYHLKHRKAYSIGFTLEDLLNPGGKGSLRFDEGPDEYVLLVRGSKPAQKEDITRYIEMFDVPEAGTIGENMRVVESKKMAPEELLSRLQGVWSSPSGAKLKQTAVGAAGGRVMTIDIHEGEEEQPAAVPDSREADSETTPISMGPGMMPSCVREALLGIAIGQTDEPAIQDPERPIEPQPGEDSTAAQPASWSPEEPRVEPPTTQPAASAATEVTTAEADRDVEAMVDPTTGKILFFGPEEELERLEDLIDELTSGDVPTVYRVFPLKYTDVNAAAQLLNQVFNESQAGAVRRVRQPRQPQQGQPQQGEKPGQPGQPQGRQQPEPEPPASPARVRVVPDARTRSLFVAAPSSDIPLIVDILRKIDQKMPPGEQNIKLFRLKNLDAEQVAQNLREILGLSTTAGQRAMRLPRGGQPGQPQQGNAQQQQQMLQMQGQEGQGVVISASDNVKLTADTQTNTIIAQAPPDTLNLIENLIGELEAETNTTRMEMRRVVLANARAMDVAAIVKDVAGQVVAAPGGGGRGTRGPRGGGSSGSVSINADARTNSVILAGQAQDLDRVEQIVKDLDADDGGSATIKQFPIKGDARAIAEALRSLFQVGGQKTDIVITSNDATGVVLVKAPAPQMAEIEEQIRAMDEKVEAEKTRRPIQLTLADADIVAEKLQELFGEATRGRGAREQITVKGNKSNNTVYVQCPEEMFAEIKQVAMDMDKPPDAVQVRSFHLNHASAVDVQGKLEMLMQQAARSGGMGSVKLDLIGVVPDARTNSLIVSGGPLTFLLIDQVLQAVDVEPETPVKIETKSYTLPGSVAAGDVARNINELFRNESIRTTGVAPPTVTFNAAGNIVTVQANASQHEQILKNIIEPIQQAVGEPLQDYQVQLKYARADEVRTVIEDFMGKWRSSRGNKPQDAFTITADPNTNMLLLNCSPSTKAVFDKQLAQMDTEGGMGKPEDFIYKVKFARASELANTLSNQIRSTRKTIQGRLPISVIGDDVASTLIITGSRAEYDVLMKTVEALDVEGAGGRFTKVFSVKYVAPWTMASIISQQFQNRASRNPNDQVMASFEDGTQSIIVTANQENMDLVAKLIAEADVPPMGGKKITQFIKLENARADALANVLNQAHQAANPRRRDGTWQVSYAADMSSNRLVVTAPEDQFAEIEARIAELDVEDTGGRTTRSFAVKYAAPWTLANIINQSFRSDSRNPTDQVLASFEDGTMAIVVTANEQKMKEVEQFILEADKQNTGGLKETRFLQIKHARADEMAQAINTAFQAKTVPSRTGKWPVTVTADVASNNLIVTAPTDLFPDVEQMVTALDVAQQGENERVRQIFKLTYADPGSVFSAITESFRQIGRNPSPRDAVTATQDWWTNSIIVTASRENIEKIAQLVEEMDKPGDQLRTQNIIELANTNAMDVANSLQQIFDAANRGRRTQGGSMTVRAIEGTTKIAVLANAEELRQVKELIKQIDVQGGRAVHTVTMPELVSAKSVADNVNKLFGSQSGRRDGPTAEYHEPTNTLLVFATDAEFEKINEQVIKVLSEQPTIGLLKIFKIPLRHALADEVAKTLQDFFDKKSGVQRGGGSRPPWWGGGETAAKQIENQVTIIAEPASNMLIVYCTDTTKEIIDDLLQDIDTDEPPGGKKIMEMVVLKYMDAAEMLGILTEYLKVSKRTPEDTGRQSSPWWWDSQQTKSEEKTVLAGDTRLKAVESMNAIIIVGKPESVQDALAKIKELDVENTEGADVPRTIALKHANATEMADTLDRTFNDQARNKARGASYVPPTIVAVEATNSLIVRAKPSDYNLIEKMATGLDSEMADETGGVRILPVPIGRGVEELAEIVQQQINENENNKKSLNKDYRPSLVSIGADTTANALLVAASKAQFEEVKRLVEELVAMGPAGGTSRRVVKLKNLSPDKAKEIIEQIKQGGQGGSSGSRSSGRRSGSPPGGGGGPGRRGDANWSRDHRYGGDNGWPSESAGSNGPVRQTTCATALPILLPEIVLGTAIAQTSPAQTAPPAQATQPPLKAQKTTTTQPASKERKPSTTQPAAEPKTFVINRIEKKPQNDASAARAPAEEAAGPGSVQPGTPPGGVGDAAKHPRGAEPPRPRGAGPRPDGEHAAQPPDHRAGQPRPVHAAAMTPEEQIRAATQPATSAQLSEDAREAIHRRLTGAPVEIAEGSSDSIIIDANDEDMEVIMSIIEMLDTAIPEKRIEYVKLKNARATDLAKTLMDVFAKIEQKGERQVRPEDKVDVIADPRTNGLYIAATQEKMEQVLALVEKNEGAAAEIDKNVRSFVFANRRVTEAGDVLQKMVQSYLKQRGLPTDHINVEVDPQTNSVFVTGGESDLIFVEKIIQNLDAELPEEEEQAGGGKRPMGEADIMVVPLRVANADELGKLLNELLQKAATGDTPMKDFIRRMRLLDENGEPIAQIDLNRPIAVFGDPDSNALIIASSRENCLIMKEVAKAFDKEPARAAVEHVVMRLEFADASEVADQLESVLQNSEELTQRPGKGDKFGLPEGASGALVYRAVIKPDARTNQVLIVGRPESVAVLKDLVARLDVKGLEPMPIEIVKLEMASATALETFLSDMMEKRAEALPKGTGPNADKIEKVVIKADPRSESLIVAARPARMEELRGLIQKLDIPASALIENIRTITLHKSTATDLADKLKDLWEQRKNQRESGGGEGLKLEVPAIVADERSNSLIVAASKSDFDAIKAVVDKIEALELNPMADIYIVRLRYNSAKDLSSPFKALFDKRAEMRTIDGKVRPEDEVAIEVDEVSNSLLVAASRENYEVLARKVAELDQEFGVPGVVEFFVCDNVGAYRVKETIDELFKEGVYKSGGGGDSQVKQDREKVVMSVDDRSNILIVSASPENMELVREIYKRMNSVATPWDAAITRLITIEHGDAVKIAAQVQDYFEQLQKIREEGSGGEAKGGFGITVFADDRSNRIVVGGTKDGIDSAVEMIRKLDVEPGQPGQTMQVYTLEEAPASKVGEMITNIFQERNQPRQGATGAQVPDVKVTVESNDATNSLLINASREDHVLVADLVARLDRPSTVIDRVRVFPLERARAERVKEILEQLYEAGRGGESGAQMIAVVEDKRTNSVVVAAPPGELKNIGEVVSRLDQAEAKGYTEVGIFLCENEDAKKMSELLNEIMTGQSAQGGGGGTQSEEARELSSMLISFASTDPRGKDVFLEAIRENVQITYNERANSVIVVAPPNSLKLIKHLIQHLDMIQKRSVLVKVFTLVNADATKLVDLLEKMFAMDEGSEAEQEFQKGREIQVEGGSSSTGGVPSALSQGGLERKGTFGRPKTTFVADERTNSIIAAGWPEDVDVVADIIDQLDSRSIQDRENTVVSLVNMEAEDMQTAVESWIQSEQQMLDRFTESLSPQRRLEQEVTVVAHEPSNQLIVSASPRYKSQVLSVIEQLDQPPPQVMIQVMIAEVTLDDRFEMGMEFALQQLRFSETAVVGGNGVLQSSHFDVIGGTDVGAAGSGLAGFSFTLTGEDFNFLVRALQSDSRLEVIQRPMIMCQDNQTAEISIGQNVPFVRGTQVSDSGQVSSQVEYEDIGTILKIEPNINPDGFVYLKVEPEISNISDSTIDIGNGVLAPVFSTQKASTYVAVKDGETVVIGGLIRTTEREGESKVPLLGDIPGLGMLFRSTTRSVNKTELMIAMTPRIVRTVEDGRRLSIEERDGSGIITDNMKQSPMFGKLRIEPETESEVPSIEAAPEELVPPEAGEQPTSPEAEPKQKYGPQAPRYGPLLPGDENAVAWRQHERATASP